MIEPASLTDLSFHCWQSTMICGFIPFIFVPRIKQVHWKSVHIHVHFSNARMEKRRREKKERN